MHDFHAPFLDVLVYSCTCMCGCEYVVEWLAVGGLGAAQFPQPDTLRLA